MTCAQPGCELAPQARVHKLGHAPLYCAEHRKRKWIVWRQRHRAVTPRQVSKDVRDRSKPRTHFAIVMDLRAQLSEMFCKWERRFQEWESAP